MLKTETAHYIFHYNEHSKAEQDINEITAYQEACFYAEDCGITYPIMGAFTEWLINTYGMEKYLQFYQYQDIKEGLAEVYQMTPEELNEDFISNEKDY